MNIFNLFFLRVGKAMPLRSILWVFGMGFMASAGQAQVTTYTDGDLFIGFRATSGTGSTLSYLAKIGPAAPFIGAKAPFAVANLGGLGTDLAATFGSDWFTRTDANGELAVRFSVIGGNNIDVTPTDVLRTIYSTNPSETPWTAGSIFSQASTATAIAAMADLYIGETPSGACPVGVVQNTTEDRNYADYQPGGALSSGVSFGAFNPTNEGGVGNVLYFNRMIPSFFSSPGELLGTFSLDDKGVLTFSPPAVVAPPSVHFEQATTSAVEDDGSVFLKIIREGNMQTPFSVLLSSVDGTATAGLDFTGLNALPVNFAANQGSVTLSVKVTNRQGAQGKRSFSLTMSGATNGVTIEEPRSTTVILSDAGAVPAVVSFAQASYVVNEAVDGGQVVLTVKRQGNLQEAFSVNFSTTNGSALAGLDYTAQSNVVVGFLANQTTTTVSVPIFKRSGIQGDRTFTVALAGAPSGVNIGVPDSATVTINDMAEGPAVVSFAQATYAVSEAVSGGNVEMTLTRTGNLSTAFTIKFSTIDGRALAGTDYVKRNLASVAFAANQSSATLQVPILNRSGLQGNRSFRVKMEPPPAGVSLFAPIAALVTIEDFVPFLPGEIGFSRAEISALAYDAEGRPNTARVTVARVGGSSGAVSVTVSVIGGSLVNGSDYEVFAPTVVTIPDGAKTGSFAIPLKAIPNDSLPGNIFLKLSTPTGGASLGVQTTTTVTLVGNGDSELPTLEVTSPVTSAVSDDYQVTGIVRDNKSIGRVDVEVNGVRRSATIGTFADHRASFRLAGVRPENGLNTLVLQAFDRNGNASPAVTLVVNYQNTRPMMAGVYNGLLVPEVKPSNNLSGRITLAVTRTGVFTGKVTLGAYTVAVSGVFANDRVAEFSPASTRSLVLVSTGAVPFVLGSLSLSIDGDKVTGSLRNTAGVLVSRITGDRAFFDSVSNPVPVIYRPNGGRYTVIFPARLSQDGVSEYPRGDGFGTMTLSAAGRITLVGRLADGQPISVSSTFSRYYTWSCFAQLYNKRGSLGGEVAFNLADPLSDFTGNNLLWIRPRLPGQRYYGKGWPAGIQLDMIGSRYRTGAVDSTILPGLGPINRLQGNAHLLFADGKLANGPLQKNFNVLPGNVIAKLPVHAASFTLRLDPQTGLFFGDFLHSDLTRPSFQGAILQKGASSGGYFLSTPRTTGESGSVSLVF